MWKKLKIFSRVHKQLSRGKSSDKKVVNVTRKSSVNGEYERAFRTISYTEIRNKVQEELGRTDQEHLSSFHVHLTEFLQPGQQTVLDLIQKLVNRHDFGSKSNLHQPILDFFNSSAQAFDCCGFLLQTIEKSRSNYKIIQRIIASTQENSSDYTDEQCKFILSQLYSFSQMDNPLSDSGQENFTRIHDLCSSMLKQVKSIRRKIKLIGFRKKACGVGLVLACTTLVVVAVILTTYGFVGILAAPILISSSWVFLKHRFKMIRKFRTSVIKRVDAQLDAAEKGAYILYREFDTMRSLVTRLYDEIEHHKGIISICLKNKEKHLLRQVVKEFEINEPSFIKQLEELEEHLYLCILTINRARRIVFEEISEQ